MGRAVPEPGKIVLVVEDEPILRMYAADLVEEAGFEVVEAADAAEAVAILERRGDIRIVFTDIDMPRGIDGLKLAALIRDRWPPISIIVTSGKLTATEDQLPEGSRFFSKPYQPQAIAGELMRISSKWH